MGGTGGPRGTADLGSSTTRVESRHIGTAEPATGRTAHPTRSAGLLDLQGLLSEAVQRLATTTGASRVFAWAPAGGPASASYSVCAAAFHTGRLTQPDPHDARGVAALVAAGRALDLAETPELQELAERHEVSAGAALCASDGDAIALLLLGGDADPAGDVRPRTLARLEHAIARLRTPAQAVRAAARLGRLDAEIQRLDRLATLGDLLAEIVHEVRNPIVSMKTFLGLLPERRDDPEFHTDFRAVVAGELERMERLIDSLLRQAAPGNATGEAHLGPVCSSVERLLAQRAQDREVALEIDVADTTPAAPIHEDALRQILLNLVLNAIDATPPGGRVTVRGCGDDAACELWVDDSGPGVPEPERARIFEPFYSTRDDAPGGLGLAVSQRIAREAGGDIEVEDAPEGGARFRLRLPLQPSCEDEEADET